MQLGGSSMAMQLGGSSMAMDGGVPWPCYWGSSMAMKGGSSMAMEGGSSMAMEKKTLEGISCLHSPCPWPGVCRSATR